MLDHADLHLITRSQPASPFTSEQIERRNVLFELLISIFERAYILVYDERMGRQASRLWQTWADYIREWCRRPDFRELLPSLLQGEDPDFQNYIRKIAEEEAQAPATARLSAATASETAFQAEVRRSGYLPRRSHALQSRRPAQAAFVVRSARKASFPISTRSRNESRLYREARS